jgi:4-amino-4-deoxy-L-arabinose transferase-like glycosyltransferase
MDNILQKLTRNNILMFSLIFVISIAFYLYNIGFSDLWSDETYTKSMLNGTFSDFYTKFKNELHPPLYYLGLRLYTGLFGLTTTSLRTFSVVGVFATLLLGYFAGQRIFGRQGALYLCLLLISVPMLAVYSHQARMYTWAAFSITGVFIYSCLLIRKGATRDLVLLFIFTVAAMYIHYYSMIAAFVANLYVFLHLVLTKNKKWINHLLSLLIAALLFLPWLSMFIVQVKRVQDAFWAPEVSFQTILSCFTIPFTEQFWTTGYSKSLIILMYALIVLTIFLSFTKSFSEYRLVLWLSLFIFLGTLLIATVISLFSQPILYSRYVVVIVPMLVLPITILLIRMKIKWMKIFLIPIILFLGVRISLSAYSFSYGPYKQTIEYITNTYPEIRKIIHITEVTAGPMIEYNGNSGLRHFWLKAEMSNVDVFPEIQQYQKPGEFLKSGEKFCVIRFHNLELNQKNLDLVLSESELIKKDTVHDKKFENGIFMQLYLLKYKGSQTYCDSLASSSVRSL